MICCERIARVDERQSNLYCVLRNQSPVLLPRLLASHIAIGDEIPFAIPAAGGVANEWVTQTLRQGDAKVFKKYSQMKLQMKREALIKLNRQANESMVGFDPAQCII